MGWSGVEGHAYGLRRTSWRRRAIREMSGAARHYQIAMCQTPLLRIASAQPESSPASSLP